MSRKQAVLGDQKLELKKTTPIDEAKGKMAISKKADKIMHSVIDNDKDKIDEGKMLKEAINYGLNSFSPDLMFEQMVRNYKQAEKIYGEKLLRQLTGYDPSYLERNMNIPEFQREIKRIIEEKIDWMKKDKLLNQDGEIQAVGEEIAALTMYIEELDKITPKGDFGEKKHKETMHYGEKTSTKNYKKGDRYRDIAIKNSIKRAIRRGHDKLEEGDLKSFERQSKGQLHIVYAMDASGSMKGKKIEQSKKAGIALAYKAIENKDKVGVISFGTNVKQKIFPSLDFGMIVKEIANVRAAQETNFKGMVKESITMFPGEEFTKHLIILSDALPTAGEDPVKDTLEAVSLARDHGITTSLIGIGLDDKGEETAKRIVEVGQGKLYVVRDIDNLDKIILEDYYSLM